MAEHEFHKINLLIITPYEDFYEGMVDSVRIPTSDGEFGFMAGHTPFVAALEPGICTLTAGKEVKHCYIYSVYLEKTRPALPSGSYKLSGHRTLL